jgi:hypothetical protein
VTNWKLRVINFWGPFLGAGIRVDHISPDLRAVTVSMGLHFWNRSYGNAHFGGSLYSMTDLFFNLMLTRNLGLDYIVWDRAATIRFLKPATSRVYASFNLSDGALAEIRERTAREQSIEQIFTLPITNAEGMVVAEVDKVFNIRRKQAAP